MQLPAESGSSGSTTDSASAPPRRFWAKPSFGAAPIDPYPLNVLLRWALVAAFALFIAAGEASGVSRWHLGVASAALVSETSIATVILLKSRRSPNRLFRAWSLVLPADIATVFVVASVDQHSPSIIPTIAIATVVYASQMFRGRDALVLGVATAAGTMLAYVPRHGLDGLGAESLLQASIALAVTGFTVSRGWSEEGLRRTLMAAERRERERNDTLRTSEAQLKFAMAAGRIGSWGLDLAAATSPESNAERFVDRAPEALGLALGGPFGAVHRDDRVKLAAAVQRTISDGEPLDMECRLCASGGDEARWLRVAGDAIRDEGGVAVRIEGVARDVTDRRRGEEALRESEERFRATFEKAAVGIALVAPDGRWLRVNQKLCEMVGYTHDELLERTFADITHPDDVGGNVAGFLALQANEIQTYAHEKRYIRKDGSPVWVNLTASLARTALGEPDYVISVTEDISERKQAEEALRESEEKWRGLFAILPVGISVLDGDGAVVDLNHELQRILGTTREGLLAGAYRRRTYLRSDHTPIAPEDFPSARAMREQRSVERVEIGVVKEDGALIWT